METYQTTPHRVGPGSKIQEPKTKTYSNPDQPKPKATPGLKKGGKTPSKPGK